MKTFLLLLLTALSCLAQGDVEDLMLLRVPSAAVVIPGPDSISGLKLWFKPESLSSSNNGDAVGSWTDSSGNGWNATQGTAGAKPYYTNTALGSFGAVYFDGVDDKLSLPAGALGIHRNVAGSTAILVVKKGYVSGEDYWYRARNNVGTGQRFACTQNGTDILKLISMTTDGGGVSQFSAFSVTTNKWNAETYWMNYSGSNAVIYTNSVMVMSSAQGTAENTADTDSDEVAISNGSALGWLSELIVYNKALSAGERTTVNTYLTNKYGVYPW